MSKDNPSVHTSQAPLRSADRVLSRFLALEQRVLLDAAAVETVEKIWGGVSEVGEVSDSAGDALSAALFDGDVVVAPLSAVGGAREVLFIDSGVEDYSALVRDLGSNVEVHVLQGADWDRQIQAVLGRRDGDVSAIHIVSHGGAGRLVLGGEVVNAGSLDSYARAWSAMRQALEAGGDLLIYGCDVAAGDVGRAFVHALADRTGADVAASEDLSGVAGLGGNWELELQAGEVTTRSLYANGAGSDFMGLLADGWVEDPELTTGTSGVAITRTTDGKDWKFVSSAGSNSVAIYERNAANGNWVLFATKTGNGSFGYDIASAGNKLVVGEPTYNNGTNDGRVWIYSYNGSNWDTVQTINHQTAAGSGQTGKGANQDNDRGDDRFGHSVDIAWDGGTGYRLVVGNPEEDWWRNNDNAWGSDTQDQIRDNAGVAYVYSATAHTGNFGASIAQIESQQGGTVGNGHRFGDVVAVSYDSTSGNWWVAVGGSGLDQVRTYLNPTGTIGGGTSNGAFAWTGVGNNALSMDDDFMVIANSGNIQAYKLNAAGTTWAVKGAAFGGGNAVVYVDDWSQAAGDPDGARVLYSYADGTYIADLSSTTGGEFDTWFQVSTRVEVAVAIDRRESLDLLTSNGSNARSYHYNWDPVANDDAVTGNEDSSFSINVVLNDTDDNIIQYGTRHGDVLAVQSVSASIYGASVSWANGTVTYNPTTSAYLQTLALGQTAQEVLEVIIHDGNGGVAMSLLTVTIEGRNDAPVITGLLPLSPFRQQQSGSTVSYDLSAYFNDIDQGDNLALTPEVTGLPAGWTWAFDGPRLLLTVPAIGATAVDGYQGMITVRVRDPHNAVSPTRNFVIEVDAVNNAPWVQNPVADQVALSQYEFAFQLPASTFHDPDPAPFDVLTYTATLSGGGALPAWLTFDAANRLFVGTPSAGDTGTLTVRVTASDGSLTAWDEFTITIVDPSLSTVAHFADGDGNDANFGFSTAISQDGNWMIVGSPGYNNGQGEVRYFQWNGSGWTYRGRVVASDGATNDRFGWSVDIDDTGTKIIVGSRNDDNGSGSAYVYTRSGTTFGSQVKYQAATRAQNDFFGTSVAINESGTHILIGASHYDTGGVSNAGAAFLRSISGDSGTVSLASGSMLLPKDGVAEDRFGTTVAFDQNIIVVSAAGADNASGIIARLQFDESDGVYAAPTLGGVGGTLGAGTGFVSDPSRGSVVRFSDTGSVILLDSPIDLDQSWTISVWYNGITSGGGYRTLTRGSSEHQIIINTGTNTLGVYNNSGSGPAGFVSSGYTLTAAQLTGWHHIVAVGEGTTTKFYIDGVLVGTSAFKATDDVVAVGNFQGGGQRFANMLDDFRVYGRALSQSEIRNIYTGVAQTDGQYNDMGALYVFSTDVGGQVAKLYAPDGKGNDQLGWSISVDVYNVGGTRMSGVIVASSIYNAQAATNGGAVYVWRSNDLQSGGDQWNGQAGNGTWDLETKLMSYDVKSGDYFGYAVAVDVDESTGGTRLVVGTPFESSNGAYSGAVYAYKYQSGVWLPEKFVDADPQGGSQATSAFFGSAVGVAGTRAVFASRQRDTGGQINDGAAYSVNLLTQGNYSTLMSTELPLFSSFAVPDAMAAFAVDTSSTQGELTYGEDGQLVYTPGESFRSLKVGETAEDRFTYFTEQNGITYTNEVVITVQGQDRAPEAMDDILYVSADGPGILDVLANDTGGLTLLSVDAGSLLGSLSNEGSHLVYDPQGLFDSLRHGEAVQQTFTYTAVDMLGNEVKGRVTLLVTGVDHAAVAVDDSASVNAGDTVSVNVLANDHDRNGAETFWLMDLDSSGVRGNVTYEGNGVVTYTPGDAFKNLRIGETAVERIVYRLRDESGNESSALLVITVHGMNDGSGEEGGSLPMPGNDVAATRGTAPVVIPVTVNDGGGQVVSVSQGEHGSVTVREDGTLLYVPGNAMALLPAGTVLVDSFEYSVEYDDGRVETATVRVHVNGTYVTPRVLDDDEKMERLTLVPAPGIASASLVSVMEHDSSSTVVESTFPSMNVAEMALNDLLQMAEEDRQRQEVGEQSDEPVLPESDSEVEPETGKPALSAMLEREASMRQADLAALLKSLENVAA